MSLSGRLRLVEPAKFAAKTIILEAASLAAGFRGAIPPGPSGLILTLHHVRPRPSEAFDPNGHLSVTPEFLDVTIAELAALGYEIIPIDALPQRLSAPDGRPFAVVTLDDGYRDNVVHALPVFERHAAPFTVFACTGFIRRTHSMWWETALALVRSQAQLALDFGEGAVLLPVTRDSERQRAFDVIGRAVMQGDEARAIAVLDAAARKAGIDPLSFVDAQILDESELRALARHPLATIGAHSVSHRALARLSPGELYEEISVSRQVLTDLLGMAPSAFAFPYGHHAQAGPRDYRALRELGFTIGVTTVQARLTDADQKRLTGLPRINLDGRWQKRRYIRGLASGLAFKRG